MTQKRALRFGLLSGRVHVSADFDAPMTLEEIGGRVEPLLPGDNPAQPPADPTGRTVQARAPSPENDREH